MERLNSVKISRNKGETMKKFISILLAAALTLSLTACGNGTQPSSTDGNNPDQSQTATGDTQNTTPLSDTKNPAASSKLGITFVGENQAVFTFTDEIVKTIENSDENSPYIEVYIKFDMSEGNVINLSFTWSGWYLICTDFSTNESKWDANGATNSPISYNGDTAEITVNKVGIASELSQYTDYRIILIQNNSAGEFSNTLFGEGKTADIISNSEAAANGVTLECYSENAVKLEFFCENIESNVNNNHCYSVYLYKTQEDFDRDNRDNGISAEIYNDTGAGFIRAVGTVYNGVDTKFLPEKGNSTAYIFRENSCAIRLACNGIKNKLNECGYYRVVDSDYNNDSQNVVSVGTLYAF